MSARPHRRHPSPRALPDDALALLHDAAGLSVLADLIAARLAEHIREETGPPTDRLLTAAEVSHRLGVAPSLVYAHALELGGVRLGDGPKAPWRFEPAAVDAWLRARSTGKRSHPAGSPATTARAASAWAGLAPNALDSLPKHWRDEVGSGRQSISAPASAETPPGPAPEIAAPMRPARYSSCASAAGSSLPRRGSDARPKGAELTRQIEAAEAAAGPISRRRA